MPITPDKTYDAIVIGAGISGLVCASYLAKGGMKVLVVEQHDKPGGCCTSFSRKGFQFDAAVHSFGSYRKGGNVNTIFSDLGLDKILKINRFDPSDAVWAPDFRLNFRNANKDTLTELISAFPAEKENITRFHSFITSLNTVKSVGLKNKSFADLLNSYFRDERLINALALPVAVNTGLPPSSLHADAGSWIFWEFLGDAGYYPEGGMQSIANSLDTVIMQHRGKILYRTPARKILIKDNSVAGIRTDNRESYFSKYVVSACDITQTFKTFLGGKIIPITLLEKLNTMIPSLSFFVLYMGIDKVFRDLPPRGTNVFYLPYYDLDKIFRYLVAGDFDNAGAFLVRTSPDMKTILAFVNAPYKTQAFWQKNKKRLAENLLDRIEQVIPDLRQHIAYFDAATPHTIYRFTRNYKGAAYGWAPLMTQLFDPDFQLKSFINGLYLTGHWTTITHGLSGVAYLGRNTAKLILKKENIGNEKSIRKLN